ncbi:hypothetical protein [Streptacidiphilus sp. EB129]|uniref:hypothetical protein n=1 Tax=Streptacidiphilus sp. EB129 TaxID=3156262 RepID=UPI0035114448
MAVENENVEKLMEWLADGSPARSAHAAAGTLVEKLAVLVFDGEQGWADNAGQVDGYRDDLRAWFANDGGREFQFIELTGPDADPGVFIDWFLPVVTAWEDQGAQADPGAVGYGGYDEAGLQNPNWDGTPGTEFYRCDEATQEYFYADGSDSVEWLTYDQRRYAEPVRDENYGLDYRYDNRDQVYEWHDEATGTWRDQAWADGLVAGDEAPGGENSETTEPGWDENWSMFYRIGPGGTYEFADAVTPGDRSSGCGDGWLSQEQVLARDAQDPLGWEQAAEAQSVTSKAIESAVAAEVAAAVAEIEGAEELTPEQLAEIQAELVAEFSSMATTATPGGV